MLLNTINTYSIYHPVTLIMLGEAAYFLILSVRLFFGAFKR